MAFNDKPAETIEAPALPHWNLWETALWALLIMAVFIMLQLITVFAAAFISYPVSNLSPVEIERLLHAAASNGVFLSLATLVTAVFCSALIVKIIKLKKGARVGDYLGLKPFSVLSIAKWVFFLVVLIVLSDVLTRALERPAITKFDSDLISTGKPFWLLTLALVAAAPLFEELFFRGFLFKGLELSFLRPAGAVIVTSALFAGTHAQYDLYGMATIFFVGLLLGAARLSTGSIFAPMILHASSNGLFIIQAAVMA
jgi:membrane protease YdiL (CAAX protease family)